LILYLKLNNFLLQITISTSWWGCFLSSIQYSC